MTSRPAAPPAIPSSAEATEPLNMRTALVHDWFQGYHGAERTVAAMLDMFAQDPEIFTFHAARELDRARVLVGEEVHVFQRGQAAFGRASGRLRRRFRCRLRHAAVRSCPASRRARALRARAERAPCARDTNRPS